MLWSLVLSPLRRSRKLFFFDTPFLPATSDPLFCYASRFWHLQAVFCSSGKLRPSFLGTAHAFSAEEANCGSLEPSFFWFFGGSENFSFLIPHSSRYPGMSFFATGVVFGISRHQSARRVASGLPFFAAAHAYLAAEPSV